MTNKIAYFIKGFSQTAQIYIEKYETIKGLSGKEKKAKLDEIITQYTLKAIDNIGLNFLVKLIIKNFIISNIPAITQQIFNLIEKRVSGITEK